MLIIAGLGLYNLRDVSVGTLEALRKSAKVYVELYTSLIPGFNVEELERVIGKSVQVLRRSQLEGDQLNQILHDAEREDVVLLAPGDPFVATTHNAIRLAAIKRGVKVAVLPAPSIINAILASTGLHIYKVGRPVTIVRPTPSYFPSTPYYVFYENLSRGLHTLFLLDLDVEKGYAMTACEAIEILRLLEGKEGLGIIGDETLFIAVARASSPDETVKVVKLGEMPEMGPPPHSLVVPGYLNPVEMEILQALADVPEALLVNWNRRVVSLMRTNTHMMGQLATAGV